MPEKIVHSPQAETAIPHSRNRGRKKQNRPSQVGQKPAKAGGKWPPRVGQIPMQAEGNQVPDQTSMIIRSLKSIGTIDGTGPPRRRNFPRTAQARRISWAIGSSGHAQGRERESRSSQAGYAGKPLEGRSNRPATLAGHQENHLQDHSSC